MSTYKTIAIVLKRRNQGESDRVLTLFSPSRGRFSAIAKGARKMKSKLAGGIELFTKSDFVMSEGKTFEIVSEASPLVHYFGETEDIRRIDFAHLASEMITRLLPENHPAPELYEAVEYALSNPACLSTDMLELYLISKVAVILGIYPELGVCLECREKPSGRVVFSYYGGGIYCKECAKNTEAFEVSKDTVKLWRYLLSEGQKSIEKLRVSDQMVLEALGLARNYIVKTTANDYYSLNYTH